MSSFHIYACSSDNLPQAIGPLYPFANYKIINSLILAASSYCAIALLCCFIIFPETVNHVYLGIVSTILGKVQTMLSMQNDLLSPKPGDFGPKCPKLKTLLQLRAAVAGMFQTSDYPFFNTLRLFFTPFLSVLTLTPHLKSEFSVGRWNGDDASSLADPLLAIISRISAYFRLAVDSLP